MPVVLIKQLQSLFLRYLRLPFAKKSLLAHAFMAALVMRTALSIFSLQRILHVLRTVSCRNPERTPHTIDDILHTVAIIGRRLPFTTCLVNGLTGQYLLARNGYLSTLHIGVKKEFANTLAAHAWVTVDDQVVIGMLDDLHTYTKLPGIDVRA